MLRLNYLFGKQVFRYEGNSNTTNVKVKPFNIGDIILYISDSNTTNVKVKLGDLMPVNNTIITFKYNQC